MAKQKVIVYVDGFNFYYGLKKHTKWKKYYWIDLARLFESFLRPDQELVAVKYFSARVDDLDKSLRQNAFFQANKENPKFQLILGKYLKKTFECFSCHRQIHTHEEKETDVRIATQIVADAYKKNCDIAMVVSADSDMIPAVELALEAGQKVFAYFPPFQVSTAISLLLGKAVRLERYESKFKAAMLPDEITLKASGHKLKIPPKWKSFQTAP